MPIHRSAGRARLIAYWSTLPGNLRGALWMLLAGIGFTGMTVCIKLAGQTMPVFEIIILRAFFAMLVIAPAIVRSPAGFLRTSRPGAHVLRSVFGICGVTTMMLALTHLDLALATTLGFTRTLFMIILAVLFLGEVVRWRRTAATLVGFIGVIICIQPGATEFDPWTLVGVVAALFAGGVTTMIKRLTSTEPPLRIMVWSYSLIALMALGPAILEWQQPTLNELGYIAAMGVFSAWGQSCMVNSLRVGEATAVAPFEYSRLVFAAAIGFIVFQEIPSGWTWVGTAFIVGSTLYIAVREATLARQGKS
ncbi:MAG: DMT family transporter [Chromatiales bacterium]|jgi:drug/metabolite transporter (DMT)-like permease|nr:DMT family transporter [Chromatiales bacterium]